MTYTDDGSGYVEGAEPDCWLDRGGVPRGFKTSELIVIQPAELPPACTDRWEVEVWVDREGRLRGTNLMLGEDR